MEIDLKDGKWAKAIFAGGCFWCMETGFDATPGVVETMVGYTGGKEEAPDYETVASGRTGHAEAVLVLYDPEKVTYDKLLEVFWQNIDPTQENGQFYDHGPQYRTEIFYIGDEQKRQAEASKKALEKSGRFNRPIVTRISPATRFWRGEEYHQDYYRKNPLRYNSYKNASGREAFKIRIWKNERK